MTDHEKLQAQRREAQRQVILTRQHQADAQRVEENVRKFAAPPVSLPVHGEPVAYVVPASHITHDGSMEDGPDDLVWADEASEHEKHIGTPLGLIAVPKAAPPVEYRLAETDIYDFAGWLTTRPGVIEVGSSKEAGPMADAVGEYLETFPERFAPKAAPPESAQCGTVAWMWEESTWKEGPVTGRPWFQKFGPNRPALCDWVRDVRPLGVITSRKGVPQGEPVALPDPYFHYIQHACGSLSLFTSEDDAADCAERSHGPRPYHPLYTAEQLRAVLALAAPKAAPPVAQGESVEVASRLMAEARKRAASDRRIGMKQAHGIDAATPNVAPQPCVRSVNDPNA